MTRIIDPTASSEAMGRRTIDGRLSDAWSSGLIFIVVVICLVAANWKFIEAPNLEYGDFAANSILIQDAKAGRLLVGNYSRVGFNHPGPAILGVLAAGEAILFDRLHWVPSPFSGQLVAVAFYNAFWVVLIARLWGRMARDRTGSRAPLAVVGPVAFLVATALLDVRFFTGPWFPHLYYFPFAAFLFAVASLATGRSQGVPSLALCLGFLVNGHVAFVPITAIVLSFALVSNWRAFGRVDRDRVVARRRWMTAHRGDVLTGVAIVAVLLVPFALETIERFPGPIGDYLQFGSGRRRNSLIASLRFVAMYWGGLPFLILPVSFAWMASRFAFEDVEWARSVRAVLATATGASVAVLFYACFGVDMLYSAYIGFFYCAVAALVAMLAICCAVRSPVFRRQGRLILTIGLVAFAIACFKLDRENDYTGFYRAPDIATLHEALRKMPREGRIVVDLPEPDFAVTWPVVAGIEAEALRRGDDLLCIAQNWHVLFSRHARCTAEEAAKREHLVARATKVGSPDDDAVVRAMGVGFYRSER